MSLLVRLLAAPDWPHLTHLAVSLRIIQEPGEAFSNHVVQAALLFEHSCPIAPRDFINSHGNLDYGSIQCAQRAEQLVEVGGSDAVETQFWQ